jgi:hypothetical protein
LTPTFAEPYEFCTLEDVTSGLTIGPTPATPDSIELDGWILYYDFVDVGDYRIYVTSYVTNDDGTYTEDSVFDIFVRLICADSSDIL